MSEEDWLTSLPEDDFWKMDVSKEEENLTAKEQYLKDIGRVIHV